MKHQLLAIIASDAPWQYYNKFELYLKQLNHPFRHRIVFYRDYDLSITAETIKQYGVVAFYYHDPLASLYPEVYQYAKRIEAICQLANIPLINKPDALSDTTKSVQLNLMREGGFQVAKAYPFNEVHELANIPSKEYPIFIRIEAGHDSQGEFVQGPFNSFEELSQAFVPYDLQSRTHHKGMVAIQFIETEKLNGLYSRYRCIVTKNSALKAYADYSSHWYIHFDMAIKNDETATLNRTYASTPFSNEELSFFLRANEVLDLDFCAYDYSIKPDGNIVIWEGNPHPGFGVLTDMEPLRSNIVNLLSNYYESFLPSLPLKYKVKQTLRSLLR